MDKFSKKNRHRSNQQGIEFVKSFNGLRIYPTYETEINIPGKNAKVDVSLNLSTHPIPELTDISPLEEMQANMEKSRKARISAVPSPVAPAAPAPTLEQKRKRLKPWGWVAIAAGVIFAVAGGLSLAAKKSA